MTVTSPCLESHRSRGRPRKRVLLHGRVQNIIAARYHYAKAHGLEIEELDGEVVCRKCDNPRCINVDHLFLGTTNDNVQDKVAKGRQYRGEGHHFYTLSEEDKEEIRRRLKPRCPVNGGKALAAEFHVTPQRISQVVHGN